MSDAIASLNTFRGMHTLKHMKRPTGQTVAPSRQLSPRMRIISLSNTDKTLHYCHLALCIQARHSLCLLPILVSSATTHLLKQTNTHQMRIVPFPSCSICSWALQKRDALQAVLCNSEPHCTKRAYANMECIRHAC